MDRAITAVTIAAIIMCAPGCAMIINGKTQSVMINTEPPGADCVVDADAHVKTPAAISLARSNNHSLACSLAGFDTAYGMIGGRISGWALLDTPLLIPVFLDFDNDSAFNLSPNPIVLSMVKRAER